LIYSFGYDALRKLVSITDAYGKTTTIQRDTAGNFTGVLAPFGQETTVTLNGDGRLMSVADPAGKTHSMTYHSSGTGLLKTFTKPGGQVSTFTYDSEGLLLIDERTGGEKTTLSSAAIDLFKNVITVTTKSTKQYQITQEYGSSIAYKRSFTGLDGVYHESGIDPNAYNVEMNGDQQILSKETEDPRFGESGIKLPSLESFSGPSGSFTYQYAYFAPLSDPDDPFSYSTITKNMVDGMDYSSAAYTKSSHTWTFTSFEGRVSTKTLDSTYERVVQTDSFDSLPIDYTYNSDGKLSQMTQGTRVHSFFYNPDGLLSKVTNPAGQDTLFDYDLSGRLTKRTLPDLNEVNYAYDDNGKLTSVTTPGSTVHTFSYDLNSEHLIEYLPPSLAYPDVTTNYSYDLDGMITQIDKPGKPPVTFSYLLGSQMLSQISNGTASYTYNSYDNGGVANSIESPYSLKNDIQRTGSFLIEDKLTNLAIPRVYGKVQFTYDSKLRLGSLTIRDTGDAIHARTSYAYDLDGSMTSAGALDYTLDSATGRISSDLIDNIETTYTYDSYGALNGITVTNGATVLYSYSINRDALGRIDDWTESILGVSKSEDFDYDTRGRLKDIFIGATNVSHYNYGANSNSGSGKIRGATYTATFDGHDRLRTFNTLNLTYNADGDLTTKANSSPVQNTQYTWDFLGRLKDVTLPSGDVVHYKYDGLQRKSHIVVNSTSGPIYLYQDSLRPVAEMNNLGNFVARFVWGRRPNVPEFIIKGGAKYRIIADPRGSVRLVVNTTTGTIAQRMDYDERGRVSNDTNPGFQPFGFAGGLYDYRTGLVQFGARHYDGQLGRWLSKDPILFNGGDTNLYSYVANDPVNWSDPSGLARCTYSISTGQLACSSNDGSQNITVKGISGSSGGGPLPVGHYDIRKAPGQTESNWFLDPGLLSRIGYRLGLNRGGFNLHLPGRISNGCISVPTKANLGEGISDLNTLLTNEAGSNVLDVVQ
jgi:RHS repeat-associated protein